MPPIITVEHLSKAYRIGSKEERPDTIVGQLTSWLQAPWKNWKKLARLDTSRVDQNQHEDDLIWALNDVSFEVQEGEVLGIIGRNGAGKSTLLKILSRITEPTAGRAILRGRISSLLEVGTGFHPELTGRENIYMNGTILGMTKREIDRKFDEIVAFSGVEKFLDTPIKRYSSGMKVRLAFAVAAHLEPEILIIDEVLAVGDAEFQQKCLGKMQEVSRSGRTVLFVSHNMPAVQTLCSRALVIERGKATPIMPVSLAIEHYSSLNQGIKQNVVELSEHPGRRKSSINLMKRLALLTADTGEPVTELPMGKGLALEVEYTNAPQPIRPVLGIVVKNYLSIPIFGVNNRFILERNATIPSREGKITCIFERLPLLPGEYTLDLYLGDKHQDYDTVYNAASFTVVAADVYGTGKLPPAGCGVIFWYAKWEIA